MLITEKKCGRCKLVLSIDRFSRKYGALPTTMSGWQSYCRICCTSYSLEYYHAVRKTRPVKRTERQSLQQKLWQENNRERYRAYQRIYQRNYYHAKKKRAAINNPHPVS